MNRTIRFIVICCALLILCDSAVFAQDEAAHQQFLFGYKLLQRKEYTLAANAFDEYLEKYPSDAKRGDALYYRALIAQQSNENARAAAYLKTVPDPQHVPVYAVNLLRGQVHCDLGQFDHALAALEAINVDKIDDPEIQASIYQLMGKAYRALNNLAGAADALQRAGAIESSLQGRALLDLARVHVMRGQHEKALETLAECLKKAGDDVQPAAAKLAGDQAYKLEQYDDAIAFYNVVIDKHSGAEEYGPSIVGVMWAQFAADRHDQVIATYAKYKDLVDERSGQVAKYLAGSAEQKKGNFAEASKLLNPLAATARGQSFHAQLLYKIALGQFEQGEYDAMNQTLTRLLDEHPKSKLNLDGQFLFAAADAKSDNFKRGIERLTAIIDYEPAHPYRDQAMLHRAQVYRDSQQLDKAVDDYLRYFALPGKIDEFGRFTDHETVLRLLELQYELKRYDAVDKTAERLATSNPPPRVEQEGLYRRALALLKLQKNKEAVEQLTTLINKYPDSEFLPQWRYYRGLLRISMNDRNEGLSDLAAASDHKALEDGLKANALRLIAMAQRDAKNFKAAAETLMKLKNFAGLTADEMYWLATRFAGEGRNKDAMELLDSLLTAIDRLPPRVRGDVLFLAGNIYYEEKEFDKAEPAYKRLIDDKHPYATQAKLKLAKVYRAADKTDQALRLLTELSSNRTSRIAAEALFDRGSVYLALEAQKRAAGDEPGRAAAHESAKNDFSKITVLYSFLDLSPIPERAFIELAEIYEQEDDQVEAGKKWRELVEKFPSGPHADYARAVIALRQQKRGDAVFLFKQIRDSESTADDQLKEKAESRLKELGVE